MSLRKEIRFDGQGSCRRGVRLFKANEAHGGGDDGRSAPGGIVFPGTPSPITLRVSYTYTYNWQEALMWPGVDPFMDGSATLRCTFDHLSTHIDQNMGYGSRSNFFVHFLGDWPYQAYNLGNSHALFGHIGWSANIQGLKPVKGKVLYQVDALGNVLSTQKVLSEFNGESGLFTDTPENIAIRGMSLLQVSNFVEGSVGGAYAGQETNWYLVGTYAITGHNYTATMTYSSIEQYRRTPNAADNTWLADPIGW